MRLPRVRFTVRGMMIVVAAAACSAMVWDLRGGGMLGLAFIAPLLGALLAMDAPRGRRGQFTASVVGGTATGACLWFANFFLDQRYTGVTMGGPPSGPFSEAMFGGVPGAIVGLVVGVAASMDYCSHRLRFTVREMMMAVVLSALVLFLLVTFIQMDRGVRLLMVVVAVVVGVPPLIMIDLLKKGSGSADGVVTGLPRNRER